MRNRALALLYFLTFAPAALEKFLAGGTPEWFLKQFEGTFLGIIPALLPLQFYSIALIEGMVAVCMLGVFFKKKNHQLLQAGLILSFLTFVALGFGLRVSHKFDGAAELFFYAGLTYLIYQSVFESKKEAA